MLVLPHVPDAVRAARDGRTNSAMVYDALDRCLDQLLDLIAARQRHTPAPETVGLFTLERADRRGDEPRRTQWTFKASASNRRTLDQLVRRYKASSRSELVSVALEAMYPPADQ